MKDNVRGSWSATDSELLNKVPTLAAYADRIGAAQTSLRKLVIESDDEPKYGHLRRAAVTVTVDADGEIKCKSKEHEPTDEEKSAIKAEIAAADWPRSIPATKATVDQFRRDLGDDQTLFLFRAQTGDDILFVQQRIHTDRGKHDLPWTYWSDGRWRCIEPDGGRLPLFGLDQLASGKAAMIHEGAKAAAFCQWLVGDSAEAKVALVAHPWGSDLKDYAHLGWPGGANNPLKPDWTPIRNRQTSTPVVLVCDNDQVGVDAVTAISRTLRQTMSAVIFDDNFKKGFDLADDWPSVSAWWRGKRYVGPTLDDLSSPATWATAEVKTGEKGRPTCVVRKEFAAEWVSVTEPSVFVHRTQTNRLLKDETFNRNVRPFSDVDDTARLLARHRSSQVAGVSYSPGLRSGVVSDGGVRVLNTFRPSDVEPNDLDQSLWLEFMEHLVPGKEDRHQLMRWCATLIARPEVRMRYGVLLISETQGVGKGTLGEAILVPLVGTWNASFPNEHQLLESGFNSWLAHKRLAVVHEIYSGHSRRGYDKLKSTITDTKVMVSRKFIEEYTIDNYIHVLACSNSMNALHLDDEDRRWLVPRVTETKKDAEWWRSLYAWINSGGLGAIRKWADKFLIDNHAVGAGDHAPTSTVKEEIISDSRSVGAQLAYDLAKKILQPDKESNEVKKVVLAVQDVRTWVADRRGLHSDSDPKLERPLTLRKAMKAAGLIEPGSGEGRRPRFEITVSTGIGMAARPTTIKSHVLANFQIDDGAQWADLKKHFHTANSLWPL